MRSECQASRTDLSLLHIHENAQPLPTGEDKENSRKERKSSCLCGPPIFSLSLGQVNNFPPPSPPFWKSLSKGHRHLVSESQERPPVSGSFWNKWSMYWHWWEEPASTIRRLCFWLVGCFLQEGITSQLPALGYPLLGRKLRTCRSHHYTPGSSPFKAWDRIHLLPVKSWSHILDTRKLECEVTFQCRKRCYIFFLPSKPFVGQCEQNESVYILHVWGGGGGRCVY